MFYSTRHIIRSAFIVVIFLLFLHYLPDIINRIELLRAFIRTQIHDVIRFLHTFI